MSALESRDAQMVPSPPSFALKNSNRWKYFASIFVPIIILFCVILQPNSSAPHNGLRGGLRGPSTGQLRRHVKQRRTADIMYTAHRYLNNAKSVQRRLSNDPHRSKRELNLLEALDAAFSIADMDECKTGKLNMKGFGQRNAAAMAIFIGRMNACTTHLTEESKFEEIVNNLAKTAVIASIENGIGEANTENFVVDLTIEAFYDGQNFWKNKIGNLVKTHGYSNPSDAELTVLREYVQDLKNLFEDMLDAGDFELAIKCEGSSSLTSNMLQHILKPPHLTKAGKVDMDNCPGVTSLVGALTGLTSVGELKIKNFANLESLDGLVLNEITKKIEIKTNTKLSNACALSGTSITDLTDDKIKLESNDPNGWWPQALINKYTSAGGLKDCSKSTTITTTTKTTTTKTFTTTTKTFTTTTKTFTTTTKTLTTTTTTTKTFTSTMKTLTTTTKTFTTTTKTLTTTTRTTTFAETNKTLTTMMSEADSTTAATKAGGHDVSATTTTTAAGSGIGGGPPKTSTPSGDGGTSIQNGGTLQPTTDLDTTGDDGVPPTGPEGQNNQQTTTKPSDESSAASGGNDSTLVIVVVVMVLLMCILIAIVAYQRRNREKPMAAPGFLITNSTFSRNPLGLGSLHNDTSTDPAYSDAAISPMYENPLANNVINEDETRDFYYDSAARDQPDYAAPTAGNHSHANNGSHASYLEPSSQQATMYDANNGSHASYLEPSSQQATMYDSMKMQPMGADGRLYDSAVDDDTTTTPPYAVAGSRQVSYMEPDASQPVMYDNAKAATLKTNRPVEEVMYSSAEYGEIDGAPNQNDAFGNNDPDYEITNNYRHSISDRSYDVPTPGNTTPLYDVHTTNI